MSELYNFINQTCKEKGINVTEMCRQAKIPRSLLSELNAGRTRQIQTDALRKISAVLNASLDTLNYYCILDELAYCAERSKELTRLYEQETDENKKLEIGMEYDAIMERYRDFEFMKSVSLNRKAPVESDEGEYLEQLRNSPNTRALLHTIRYMNEEQIGAYAHFAEQIRKGGWNGKED